MASFFGEIIEPSTRAIFNEFSDEEENAEEPQLRLSWIGGDKKLPPIIDVIFIVHGKLSLAFAELYLLDESYTKIGEINIVKNKCNTDRDAEYAKEIVLPSNIYVEKSHVICLVGPSVSSDLGYHFTETISPILKISKKIVIFTNDSICNYKTLLLQDIPPAFVTELKTSFSPQTYTAVPFKTPNFITGVPAGVFSWCQIFKKDASAFICYADQEKLDSITAAPNLAVLRKINADLIKNKNPDFNKKTIYGQPGVIGGSSNIYI